MEFESTLERESKKRGKELKEAIAEGRKFKSVDEVFKLITNSDTAMRSMYGRAMHIAKIIQPSISDKDLKIASDMMSAMASQLVHNLLEEGLISINKK